jgi:hypothetical protein
LYNVTQFLIYILHNTDQLKLDKALEKQEGPNVFWDAPKLIVYFQNCCSPCFSREKNISDLLSKTKSVEEKKKFKKDFAFLKCPNNWLAFLVLSEL